VRVAIVADHNGTALKARLVDLMRGLGHHVDDRGVHAPAGGEEPGVVDYPPLCEDACRRVVDGHADRAVVVGGSGMGETVACNKLPGIRAGLCHDPFTTRISRANNDSNVMVIGAKVVTPDEAERLLVLWLETEFTAGVHARRLAQIAALERGETLL
jgi:ribose 5-phosphate isomerase B